ncbi:hemerythrin domain-containing protein [Mariniflexile gromovii]|uniref:Hemerythrin domain-containing protein n=1 Tax=Mariniflexile gromovii TaxID=362523 RepID=A0ABS4BVS4_9FLAO|nr:hemerythrin domain-containing protein [Mariniflexile gromovii]MBP0904683.1 hemerythrin domain-containing protein [Mariniflexile gromovii]
MSQKPLKRHKALQPLSREHHHGLLLSWKIRAGFSKNVEPERMKVYADWFFKTHLIPHFELEEQYVFSILKADNDLVKSALSDHKRLKKLFLDEDIKNALSKIEEVLEQHIRYEERVLFPEIQKIATEPQLELIEKIHQEANFIDKLDDEFGK